MNKNEFLAFSLPYGINVSPFKSDLRTITTFDAGGYALEFERSGLKLYPILHPLSDLTKPIDHKGDVFVPIERLYHLDIMRCDISLFENINLDVVYDHTFSNQYEKLLLKLVGWHFDIAGLIEKCEAIDVNKLEENPYK